MSASGKPNFEPLFEPKVHGFPKPSSTISPRSKRLITDKTVAVMLEPIRERPACSARPTTFLHELRELTTRRGLLLILDEVRPAWDAPAGCSATSMPASSRTS